MLVLASWMSLENYAKWKKLDTEGRILYYVLIWNIGGIGVLEGFGVTMWGFLMRWWKCSGISGTVQPCEYTKTHWILHFKMVNFMLCELYLYNNTLMFFKKWIYCFLEILLEIAWYFAYGKTFLNYSVSWTV